MQIDVIKQAFEEVYLKEDTKLDKFFNFFRKEDVKFYKLKRLLKKKYKLNISRECLLVRIKEYIK